MVRKLKMVTELEKLRLDLKNLKGMKHTSIQLVQKMLVLMVTFIKSIFLNSF